MKDFLYVLTGFLTVVIGALAALIIGVELALGAPTVELVDPYIALFLCLVVALDRTYLSDYRW